MRGWCLAAKGQAVEGIPIILDGVAIYSATGARLLLPFLLIPLAEAYGFAMQPDQGLKRIVEAAKLVEATHERWGEAEMNRVWGTLLRSMGDHTGAEDAYRALAVARRQSAKFWELRAALDLARLRRGSGQAQRSP
jgi:hypothetical protein